MQEAIAELRRRMSELADLSALDMLAQWDQRVMMPADGAEARAQQLGTLARLTHERATAEEIGAWLSALDGKELDDVDRDIVRLAHRDWERARRVPGELAMERARAGAEGQEAWLLARADDDFQAFAPALVRNVELAREYAGCVVREGQGPYDALLEDYDFGLSTGQLRSLFGELARTLPPLAAQASQAFPRRTLHVPLAAQQQAVQGTLHRLGVGDSGWRVDVAPHPFTAWIGRRDTRVTTRYGEDGLESVLAALHEYGHALYERQIDPALERTNLGYGTSMSVHESQSKLWENHVGRNPAFAGVLTAELGAGGFTVTPPELRAALLGTEPSLIRVAADPLTYPLHIVLRFELELALLEGGLAVRDLPGAWREGMQRLLGVEVPSDTLGCLQDIHWATGSFGYFPSYALGCLIAAQLWEALERELGARDEDLRRGEAAPIREWLAEHVHRHGRRLDTSPLVEKASGHALGVEPFLRSVAPLAEPAS